MKKKDIFKSKFSIKLFQINRALNQIKNWVYLLKRDNEKNWLVTIFKNDWNSESISKY